MLSEILRVLQCIPFIFIPAYGQSIKRGTLFLQPLVVAFAVNGCNNKVAFSTANT